jgi:hypothetical protein
MSTLPAVPLVTSAPSALHICPNCSPLIENLIAEARARIENHIVRHRLSSSSLDESILIIEDEFGEVLHREGDLSFLSSDLQKDYERRQLAVWDLDMEDIGPLRSKCGREAFIFPMHVEGERYTATVFNNAQVA